MRNYANFRPLGASEADSSMRRRSSCTDGVAPWQAYGTTWITWTELKAVEWDEQAELPESHCFFWPGACQREERRNVLGAVFEAALGQSARGPAGRPAPDRCGGCRLPGRWGGLKLHHQTGQLLVRG